MNKNCKLTIGAMLLLTTAFSVAEVRAQTCVVPPTCEGLGYDKTASDCGGLAKLRCPFDDSKYFCTAYTDQDGNKVIEVGDIVYADAISAEPLPGRIPVGIVFDVSGKMISITEYSSGKCSSHTVDGIDGWTTASWEQMALVKANVSKINSAIGKISGAVKITTDKSNGKSGACYNVSDKSSDICMNPSLSDDINYNEETGGCYFCGNGYNSDSTRCVREFSSNGAGTSTPTPTPTTYKVGDTYVKDGVALGKVVEVDGTGQHGYIAISGGNATVGQASTNCMSKTAGSLNWSLANGTHACMIIGDTTIGNCDATTASGNGYCFSGNIHISSRECSSDSLVAYACEAPF